VQLCATGAGITDNVDAPCCSVSKLGTPGFFFYGRAVLFFLRCIGIINAAAWLGATLFSCVILAPSLASDSMRAILPPSHAGRAWQIVLERYFVLQYWCGGIAVVHLLAEWLYTGRPLKPWAVYLALGLLGLGLAGGLWLRPKVIKLHLDLYGVRSTPQQRENARHPLRNWERILQASQYLAAIGLLVHLIQTSGPVGAPRFLNGNKFKG
jgi:hypothetical protein